MSSEFIPRLPVRQRVLCVRKRLRYHLERDPAVLNAALHIFFSAIERVLCQHSSGAGAGAASRLAAVVFIHRFGALLNTHLHFHCIVVDGTFDTDPSRRRPETATPSETRRCCARRRACRKTSSSITRVVRMECSSMVKSHQSITISINALLVWSGTSRVDAFLGTLQGGPPLNPA